MKAGEYLKQRRSEDWLVKPLIGLGHKTLVSGPKGGGKTFFCWFIARAVAAGIPIFGFETVKMPVLIIDEETPEADFVERMARLFDDEELDIYTFPRPEEYGFNFGDRAWIEKLQEKITAMNTNRLLLIIDNINATSGNLKIEIDNASVGLLRGILTDLRNIVPDLTVILIAHTGKDESKGTRGSSAQEDMSDTILRLRRLCDKPFRFAVQQVPRKRPAYLKPFIVELDTSGDQWHLNYVGEVENIELPTGEDKIIFDHFRATPKRRARSTKDVHEELEERIGLNSTREALNRLAKQGVLKLGRHAHNQHHFSLVDPLPQTPFVAALTGESGGVNAPSSTGDSSTPSQKNCDSRETSAEGERSTLDQPAQPEIPE